jgi:hypothetical protein
MWRRMAGVVSQMRSRIPGHASSSALIISSTVPALTAIRRGALRNAPAACQSFAYANVANYGFTPATEFATHYLHYAYGPKFSASVVTLCSRMNGW